MLPGTDCTRRSPLPRTPRHLRVCRLTPNAHETVKYAVVRALRTVVGAYVAVELSIHGTQNRNDIRQVTCPLLPVEVDVSIV